MVTIINTEPFDVYEHMAIDELLATQEAPLGSTLRFFNWKQGPTSATFGYAQFASQATKQIEADGITTYTRRPTGGGIVTHKDDLTFALLFNEPKLMKPKEIYVILHTAIKEAFAEHAALKKHSAESSNYHPSTGGKASACFTNPVEDDLLGENGDKVLGGAIRRYGERVIYQGSLQLPNARGNETYHELLKKAVAKFLNDTEVTVKEIDPELLKKTKELAATRYATREWIERF